MNEINGFLAVLMAGGVAFAGLILLHPRNAQRMAVWLAAHADGMIAYRKAHGRAYEDGVKNFDLSEPGVNHPAQWGL